MTFIWLWSSVVVSWCRDICKTGLYIKPKLCCNHSVGLEGGRLMFHSYAEREGRISQYSCAGYKSPLSRPVVQWRDLWPILRYQDRQIDTNSFTSRSLTEMEMSQLPRARGRWGRRGWCEMLTVTNVCCYGNNCCRCLSKVTLLASADTPR